MRVDLFLYVYEPGLGGEMGGVRKLVGAGARVPADRPHCQIDRPRLPPPGRAHPGGGPYGALSAPVLRPLSAYLLFNGHYDTWCYLPIVATVTFDDEPEQFAVAAVLRPGNALASRGARGLLGLPACSWHTQTVDGPPALLQREGEGVADMEGPSLLEGKGFRARNTGASRQHGYEHD